MVLPLAVKYALRVSKSVSDNAAAIRHRFQSATPFRHAVVEGFFEPQFAEELLEHFPRFDPSRARNEIYGGVWGKAVNTNIRSIDPAYAELYATIASQPFLDLIGELSGIPDLLLDPALFGGGTHENLHGQDLDPHVDFNYDEQKKLHRRLNLIVYLNKGWKAEWGGSIEIHSNPRRPAENRIQSYEPLFNRAVFFETNEYSWHGFPRIELPEAERHRSRKSISIYLYTRERPREEIAPAHGTFYVHRPLPPHLRAGHTLTDADMKDLLFQVDRRDKWIEHYQAMELEKGRELARLAAYTAGVLSLVRAPLTGYVLQQGTSRGIFPDLWLAPEAALTVAPQRPVTGLTLRGWRPAERGPVEVSLRLNGVVAATATVAGLFEIPIAPAAPPDQPFTLEIAATPAFSPENDPRDICFILLELRAEHAG